MDPLDIDLLYVFNNVVASFHLLHSMKTVADSNQRLLIFIHVSLKILPVHFFENCGYNSFGLRLETYTHFLYPFRMRILRCIINSWYTLLYEKLVKRLQVLITQVWNNVEFILLLLSSVHASNWKFNVPNLNTHSMLRQWVLRMNKNSTYTMLRYYFVFMNAQITITLLFALKGY